MSPVYVKSGTLFVRKRNTLQTSLFKSSKKAFNIYCPHIYKSSRTYRQNVNLHSKTRLSGYVQSLMIET